MSARPQTNRSGAMPTRIERKERDLSDGAWLITEITKQTIRGYMPDLQEKHLEAAAETTWRCDRELHPLLLVALGMLRAEAEAMPDPSHRRQAAQTLNCIVDGYTGLRRAHAELLALRLARTDTRLPFLNEEIRIKEGRTWKETFAWYERMCGELGIQCKHADADNLRRAHHRWQKRQF